MGETKRNTRARTYSVYAFRVRNETQYSVYAIRSVACIHYGIKKSGGGVDLTTNFFEQHYSCLVILSFLCWPSCARDNRPMSLGTTPCCPCTCRSCVAKRSTAVLQKHCSNVQTVNFHNSLVGKREKHAECPFKHGHEVQHHTQFFPVSQALLRMCASVGAKPPEKAHKGGDKELGRGHSTSVPYVYNARQASKGLGLTASTQRAMRISDSGS